MKLNLLAMIFGPAEIVFPVLGVFLGISILLFVGAYVANVIYKKRTIENADVVYPEHFLKNIEKMKKDRILRFYSEKVKGDLYVITTSNISEKYENGKFVVYGEKTEEVRAIKEKLKDFLARFPQIEVDSIIGKKTGYKSRVEFTVDEKPINHYSAIGFDVRVNEDIEKVYQLIKSKNSGEEDKIVVDINLGECVYKKYSIGDIKYVVKYTKDDKIVRNASIGHENQNVTVVDRNLKSFAQEAGNLDFPLTKVEKDGQPFWFSCLNLDEALLLDNKDSLKLKISSFVNNLEIKEPIGIKSNEENGVNFDDGKVTFADECYVNLEGGSSAYIHGVITAYNLKFNTLTNQKYWAIDIVCLGYNIKVLADYRLVSAEELAKGKVLSAMMWNTAFFVN